MVADNLRSAFNVGGVFRTVDAAGGEMVHLAGYTARPPHPRVLRAAMGADRLVAWKGWPDARVGVQWLLDQGFHVVGLEPSAEAEDYRHYRYRWPLGIVIGNEALGISPSVIRRLHGMVRIPMHGFKGSLNVVVALGIVLFQVVHGADRPAARDHLPDEHGGILAAIMDRVRLDSAHRGAWQGRFLEPGSAVFLLHTPQFPAATVWAHADQGGVVLMLQPTIPQAHGGPHSSDAWRAVSADSRRPAVIPLRHPPRSASRGLAFDAAVRVATARSSGGMTRLTLDHLAYELLHRGDVARDGVGPDLTRFLDAQTPAQMEAMARRLGAYLLRPMGGWWEPTELIYDPEIVRRRADVDGYVRRVLGLG